MKQILLLIFLSVSVLAQAQRSYKNENSLGNPILTDSTSTLFIPVLYNEQLLSSNKLAVWGGYYANLIVYNFVTDTSKKLFEDDTFVQFARSDDSNAKMYHQSMPIVQANRIFLLVKQTDTNGSGRIDEQDASVLYTISPTGENLQALSTGKDHVMGIQVYAHAHFALVTLQRDSNRDGVFNQKDQYYYRKLDLKKLQWGREIKLE
jgi:hypothetical protein